MNSTCRMDVLLFSRWPSIVLLAGCYLSFPANKLVSGEHCKIVQDASSGLAWLEDMRYLPINGPTTDYLLPPLWSRRPKSPPVCICAARVSNRHRQRARRLSGGGGDVHAE